MQEEVKSNEFRELRTESLKLPSFNYWTLDNGAQCVFVAIPDAPLTCFDFWIKAGSAFENPEEEGIAHFLEHMVFKGSRNLLAGEFDRKIEELGGSSNAATGLDDVHFHVQVPPLVGLEALELLLNLVLEPSIISNDFEIEREVVLEEIAQYNDQPDEKIFARLLKNCWGDHAYGKPILGEAKKLKLLSPKTMKSFHKRLYIPKNFCLAVAGIIPNKLKQFINKSNLSKKISLNQNEVSKKINKNLYFSKGREEISVDRLESSRIIMSWPIPSAKNQLKLTGIDIATTLLAEGRRSKLVNKLREELQIVESIDMDITVLEQGGLIILEACCMKQNINLVEKQIHNILEETITNEPKEKEVYRAIQLVRNGLIFGLETSSQLANIAGNNTLWGREEPLQKHLNYINYWEPKNLHKEILPLMKPELSNTLIAIPRRKINESN